MIEEEELLMMIHDWLSLFINKIYHIYVMYLFMFLICKLINQYFNFDILQMYYNLCFRTLFIFLTFYSSYKLIPFTFYFNH